MEHPINHILVVTAVESERAAVLKGLGGDSRFVVLAAGVGPVAAAVGTTMALAGAAAGGNAGAPAGSGGEALPAGGGTTVPGGIVAAAGKSAAGGDAPGAGRAALTGGTNAGVAAPQTAGGSAAAVDAAAALPGGGSPAGTAAGGSPGFDLVISAGIAGGFAGRADVGSLVVANEIVAADLGAETLNGFRSLDELGFGTARIRVADSLAAQLTEALRAAGLPAGSGTVLTLSTVTGTAETAADMARRIPDAAAEGMEGYGVAFAAGRYQVPVLELRAISNPVGPRDRAAWRIGEALQALEAACSVLKEVL